MTCIVRSLWIQITIIEPEGYGGNRPVKRRRTTPGRAPIQRRVVLGQPISGPCTVRIEQWAQKAGIPVFGWGLWHTGQRDPVCCLKCAGKPAFIWQDIGVISHIDQLTRRIPVRIDVKRTGARTSAIHVRGYNNKIRNYSAYKTLS